MIKGRQAFKTLTRYEIYKREGFFMGNFSFLDFPKNGLMFAELSTKGYHACPIFGPNLHAQYSKELNKWVLS